MLRTHTCGELNKKNIGKTVELAGWDQTRRDHGGIIFIDVRDRYGLTQIVFDPEHNKEIHTEAEKLRREDVVRVKGKVRARPKGMENPNLVTGEVEVLVDELQVLAKADTPPIEIDDRIEANEDMRLKFRYLDLRRPIMQKRLITRYNIINSSRNYFRKNNFIELETPMLVKSTPEGARDYVVPSRVNPGDFYALPQSPQLYKQILMVAGFDRYFQVPRCLRDEDLRTDRQPEHTQLDFEMSFVESKDIREFVEGLMKHLFKEVLNIKLVDFPVFNYNDVMDKYGIDKPDIRFELFLHDVSDVAAKSDFGVFKEVVKSGGIVKCINPEKDIPRKEIDKYITFCQHNGAKGMAWMRVTKDGLDSNIAKFFPKNIQDELIRLVGAKPGSILMFIADKKDNANAVLARLRQKLADDLELYDKKEFKFCWVNDFRLFAFNEDEGRWEPEHHMFSMPNPEFVDDFDKRPEEVLGDLWDLVLNGVELGSGSIRVTNPELQKKIMNFIGLSEEEADQKFGFLLDAYKYGGPPHGGMGIGLDRLVALMCGLTDIREVIPFPKNKAAQCPMDSSPSEVDDVQLRELHLKLDVVKQKKDIVFGKIREMLDNEKIEYEVIEHKAAYTSEEAAKIRGTELRQGCKALVLKTDKGFVQCVVPGDKELDLEKVKKMLKVKEAELADAKEVKRVTECNIGSVPPFGNLFGLDVYLDKLVMGNDDVAFNAGSHTKSIKMKLKDLVAVSGAKEGDFSR